MAFSLHGELRLPTRRVWVSYTADLLGTLDCLSIVASVANIQFQSPIGHWQHWDWQHFHIGNIPQPLGRRPLSMWGGFGIIHAMTIKHLQNGMIARMAETVLLPALRAVGMRGFVASRGAKAPGKGEGVLGRVAVGGVRAAVWYNIARRKR